MSLALRRRLWLLPWAVHGLKTYEGSSGSIDLDGAHLLELKRTSVSPKDIIPNDLWALHDLIIVGYGAPFVSTEAAKSEVQEAGKKLVDLMPDLHPYPACRLEVGNVLNQTEANDEVKLVSAIQALWNCLPAKFTADDFNNSLTENYLSANMDAFYEARMTVPKDPSVLGACRESKWPRTCSLWSGLHTMALRADALQKGNEFISAVIPILAGGATLCGGCSAHFKALHKPILSQALRDDVTDGF